MKSDDASTRKGEEALSKPELLLRPIAEALDSLGVAACIFDDDDQALLWNRSFLKIFPEHAAEIRVGEPYVANLRRFYMGRLGPAEMPSLERYVKAGVARHRAQHRPFAFEHRGVRLLVASLPLPGIGRIRLWRDDGGAASKLALEPVPGACEIDGTALLDHVPDGVMVSDADDRILWVNEPFVEMYGLTDREAAVGLRFEEAYRIAWHGLERRDAQRALFDEGLAVLAEHMRFAGAPFEVPLPHARWSRVIEQRSPDGRRFFAHVDITVLKRQQRRLQKAELRARESEALLRQKSLLLETTLERMEQGIMMVSADGVVQVCNERLIELLELPREFMMSRPTFQQVVDYQTREGEFRIAPQNIPDFARAGGTFDKPHRYDRERPDGRVIEVYSVPIDGGGVVRTYTDITERRRSEERIRHLARHDGLTSLINRAAFREHLQSATEQSLRSGERFAVHYIDIDDFKPVNDRFGHAVGDKVIAMAAEKLRSVTGDCGVVGRMGGDEFVILQHRIDGAAAAIALAQRVLAALLEPLRIESHAMQLGASIGIALYPETGDDADALLRRADSAMYAAKAGRKGSIRIFGSPEALR